MEMFNYGEPSLYAEGLRFGVANLVRNGFALGVKKTIGKVTQPINSYTRFPEYFFIRKEVESRTRATANRLKILDVGSPKLLGLILAANNNADIYLTDITSLNIDEYKLMWSAIQSKARGSASFAREDVRQLTFADNSFDITYSMSVLEHVEGDGSDVRGMSELIRVTKPGGMILVTVPFGTSYVEQRRHGIQTAAVRTSKDQLHFFQRIYTPESAGHLLGSNDELHEIECQTVWRTNTGIAKTYSALGENVRGLLGFLNPLMSQLVNRHSAGIVPQSTCTYGEIFSTRDIYGDLLVTARKRSAQL
jgi:ubiquinone/menaquinone biosynthesis C-methylase UbiE